MRINDKIILLGSRNWKISLNDAEKSLEVRHKEGDFRRTLLTCAMQVFTGHFRRIRRSLPCWKITVLPKERHSNIPYRSFYLDIV
jgi:hypothetical protein